MKSILEAGADGIGGCCGTTPTHIAAMKALLENLESPAHPEYVPMLATKRQTLSLKDALADSYTLHCEAGADLYDLLDDAMDAQDEEAACLVLVLGDMPADEIAELLAEGQDMFKLPLVFSANTIEQADAALRAYHGVSALTCNEDASSVASKYGAHWLGNSL